MAEGTQYTPVTPEEAAALIAAQAGQPDFVLLDVRTPEEFVDGHIEGAVNVCLTCPSPSFPDAVDALDKRSTYLVYCRSANRSKTALATMQARGFTELYELTGGTTAWLSAGLPLVR
jgi:rhodanese-related sulfurtransferase